MIKSERSSQIQLTSQCQQIELWATFVLTMNSRLRRFARRFRSGDGAAKTWALVILCPRWLNVSVYSEPLPERSMSGVESVSRTIRFWPRFQSVCRHYIVLLESYGATLIRIGAWHPHSPESRLHRLNSRRLIGQDVQPTCRGPSREPRHPLNDC